jgi:hypothetical protein
MPFAIFRKNFASFPSIFVRILMFEHFRGDWAYAEPNFLDELANNFFLQNLHFGPIRWLPRRFLKILIIDSQNLHFNLVFFEYFSKIIACVCLAYAETILSHAEHTLNRFHCTLSIRGTNFRACSASCKMWTVFTCTIHAQHTRNEFYRTLTIRWNEFHSMLSIRGTDFIACWACAEMFKSRISRLKRTRFSKISCYRPLGPYGFGFCKKKSKEKFHTCVPLNLCALDSSISYSATVSKFTKNLRVEKQWISWCNV